MKRFKIIYIVTALFLMYSCVEESNFDTNQYVINSFFAADAPFVIQATKTASIFDTATYRSLKDLQGEIYEDGEPLGDLVFKNSYSIEGLAGEIQEGYSLDNFNPIPGKEYKFELRNAGELILSASDIIPESTEFTISDTSEVLDDYDLATKGLKCDIKFKDQKGEKNYYLISYTITDFFGSDDDIGWTQTTGWMKSDDPAIEKSYYHQGVFHTGYRYVFSDEYFDGLEYTIPVSFFVGHSSGQRKNLNIYFFSISEQYYKYVISSINQQENNEDYYAEPTQVFNNINNGFGIFAGYSFTKQVLKFGE